MRLNNLDLPTPTGTTHLRRTISRVVECAFTVQDDILRVSRDGVGNNFRPADVQVRINLDNGKYTVQLQGPRYTNNYETARGAAPCTAFYRGDHYADVATDHYFSLITDAVHACLVAHELVEE